jgi:hypothetical protein
MLLLEEDSHRMGNLTGQLMVATNALVYLMGYCESLWLRQRDPKGRHARNGCTLLHQHESLTTPAHHIGTKGQGKGEMAD